MYHVKSRSATWEMHLHIDISYRKITGNCKNGFALAFDQFMYPAIAEKQKKSMNNKIKDDDFELFSDYIKKRS